MNVTINGIVYEDVQWNGSSMIFDTDMTLAEIETAFTPGIESMLIVSDGDVEVARYYNKALESISVSGSEPRTVTVTFDVTQIAENAETEIRESIDVSDGAIEELAGIVAGLSELDLENMASELQSHQETISTWFNYSSDLATFINDLRKEGGILDQFDARISALEHENGIVGVVKNEEEEAE